MANIEQVKQHFKDAEKVKCLIDEEIYDISEEEECWNDGIEGVLYYLKEAQKLCFCVKLYDKKSKQFAEIISYNKDNSEPEKSEYPKEGKLMLVSGNKINWKQRVVFMEKNGKFIAWSIAETIERAKEQLSTTPWKYAKELPTEVIVTKEEIAKWQGCTVEQLIIK